MINSNSSPTMPAATTEIGNATELTEARTSRPCRLHPIAPPNFASRANVPRSRTESENAHNARTNGSSATLSQSDLSGRFSSKRKHQPNSTAGIKKAAKPRLCRRRSARTAPL